MPSVFTTAVCILGLTTTCTRAQFQQIHPSYPYFFAGTQRVTRFQTRAKCAEQGMTDALTQQELNEVFRICVAYHGAGEAAKFEGGWWWVVPGQTVQPYMASYIRLVGSDLGLPHLANCSLQPFKLPEALENVICYNGTSLIPIQPGVSVGSTVPPGGQVGQPNAASGRIFFQIAMTTLYFNVIMNVLVTYYFKF